MNSTNNLTSNQASGHRESFVFYNSFKEAIDELSPDDQLVILHSIINYALYRQEPQLRGVKRLAWVLIKPQLDANWRKYEKGCKGGASGKLGGRPRKNPIGVISETPNDNDNDNDNVNDNVNEKENVNDFIEISLPLLEDIVSYITQNNLSVDAADFYDYYSSNGWRMGANPMVDWRAALRSWSRKTTQERPNLQITISNDL